MNPYARLFHDQVAAYHNTAEHNDHVFGELSAATASDPLLSTHRTYVEQHALGFGDPAFHAMWQQLLGAAVDRFGRVEALEIGVFKGQVVSLWALVAKAHDWDIHVHGITPFAGQPMPRQSWWRSLQARFNPWFRERVKSGDFYPAEDYVEIVRQHFAHHAVDFDGATWHRGYSTDELILQQVRACRFQIIYIDGGHTYEAASTDIANFAPKVPVGGWLVMDDAGHDLPGTTFWKGYETVARACQALPVLGFKNVLNVGHNRIYERTDG